MRYIVSLSGGLSSFYLAYICQTQGYDYDMVFCDTKTEDEDLYRFLSDIEKVFNKEIIRLSDGRNIWEVQRDVLYQANSRVDPCSRILKRELFKKWMRDNINPEEAVLWIGIGSKEKHRIKDFSRNHAPYTVQAPLTEMDIDNDDIIDVCYELGIKPPRLYDIRYNGMSFPHNNCGGFCVKAGQKQALLLLKTLPETYDWHEKEQEKTFEVMGKRHPTIRKTIEGNPSYLSLMDFRLWVENGEQIELFDEGGCACF